MATMDFNNYLIRLEQEVIVKGISTFYNTQTKFWVKEGKLLIPQLVGDVDTDLSVVISYYGFPRKSRGFRNQIDDKNEKRECFIIQFNQIKFQHILKLAPTLINDFVEFKQQLVNIRWGNE